MSVFKRAEWRSGLTYRQICDQCRAENIYMDDILDFRPWYPDGFVYCRNCKQPMRHNEIYAINGPTTGFPSAAAPVSTDPQALPPFCSQCGNKFKDNDRFCGFCGTKR